jgi:predicted NAD-dependent protein-ADP-ribosyltransferase YbiA (DUF1768 family)
LLDAMRTLATPEVAAELGARAQAHAARFTWRKVAERVIRALAPADVDRSGLAEFL